MSLSAWEKRVLVQGGDPWGAKYDGLEPELSSFQKTENDKTTVAHRDLDEVDAGLFGPSVDADRAIADDYRRAIGDD